MALDTSSLRIDLGRLMSRIESLGRIGALEGGGVCRLALSDEDRAARDLVRSWMQDLALDIQVDAIGNIIGTRASTESGPPVMTGSHIDTVATGGLYDGNLGVLAGLEIIETLNEADVTTTRPISVGVFTNEEGVRFQPDMMGSAVHQGVVALDDMLVTEDQDGLRLGDELKRIGYAGDVPTGRSRAHCFVELHVEQGPVLEADGITIGAVTGVQGISWTEHLIEGTANHAGTTPMAHRRDAAHAAAAITVEARRIAEALGGNQVATVGVTELTPNLINVIAKAARLTVDLRNTDETTLQEAETRMADFIDKLQGAEGVRIQERRLARFTPVDFDPDMIGLVEAIATGLGHTVKRMASGAGHDAQMFAANCPTAMIFVPSKYGISHNTHEHTAPDDIRAGANVLLQVMLAKAG